MENRKIEISTASVIKVILVLLAFYLGYLIRDILALLFIVLILVSAFNPMVDKLEKPLSRAGAVAVVIAMILAISGVVIWIIIPPLVNQSIQLFQNLPGILIKLPFVQDNLDQIKSSLSNLTSELAGFSSSIINFTANVFGFFAEIITGFVLFIYLIYGKNSLIGGLLYVFPEQKKAQAKEVIKKISQKTGGWFRGQLLLGAIIATANMIALSIMGVPYALTLAVISGVLEIVPTVGPIISGLLAALVALTISPVLAVIVVVWFILLQQLEGTFIVPKVMQKAVGLSPAVVILAILIGAKLYGIMGVLLSIPISALLMVIIQEWPSIPQLMYKND